MRYVLDTNVLIHVVRDSSTWHTIQEQFNPFGIDHQSFISFVSVAEILFIAKQVGWGKDKMKHLASLFSEIEIVTVSGAPDDLLIEAYVEIDSYSQGKNKERPLPKNVSARNMAKNDLWIASTTSAIQAKLITTDKDFLHLDSVFFDVILVES